MTASTAPSGANKQPWTFCAVSRQSLKEKIKEAAEAEERESYGGRMSDTWLKDLEPFGTDANKPFLAIAPWLIIVFKKAYDIGPDGEKLAGLVTLTHTPSPMNFLAKVLDRPKNERPYLLLPVGYPADDVLVPDITKKEAEQVIEWYE